MPSWFPMEEKMSLVYCGQRQTLLAHWVMKFCVPVSCSTVYRELCFQSIYCIFEAILLPFLCFQLTLWINIQLLSMFPVKWKTRNMLNDYHLAFSMGGGGLLFSFSKLIFPWIAGEALSYFLVCRLHLDIWLKKQVTSFLIFEIFCWNFHGLLCIINTHSFTGYFCPRNFMK